MSLLQGKHNSTCDYNVGYYTFGAECYRHSVGFGSCTNEVYTDFLNVTFSPCSNASEITVNVTPSDNCDIGFTDISDPTGRTELF